jgi:hypothetical protein
MSETGPKFITPLIHNLLRLMNRLNKVDIAGELSVKVGKLGLIAVESAKLLSLVNTHYTKELWSSIGHSGSSIVVKSVVDLGPPFDDINAMKKI